MLVRITDLEDTCLEMRRRAGDAKAFSLKAQRAFAEDTTKGNAHFDFDALDEKEESLASISLPPVVPTGDVQTKIDDIEQRLQDMTTTSEDLSTHTIETEYGQNDPHPHRESLHFRVNQLEHILASVQTTVTTILDVLPDKHEARESVSYGSGAAGLGDDDVGYAKDTPIDPIRTQLSSRTQRLTARCVASRFSRTRSTRSTKSLHTWDLIWPPRGSNSRLRPRR